MKRTLLDITKKISRNPQRVILTLHDLSDTDYWIWKAVGWRFVATLREMEIREAQDRLRLYINTQFISANDYIVEENENGLYFKFIKNNFQYELDDFDVIEIVGDIEKFN